MSDARRRALRKLIERGFNSQRDLQSALQGLGFRVDRSTISRDLKAMGIARVGPPGDYDLPYVLPEHAPPPPPSAPPDSPSLRVPPLCPLMPTA